MYDSYIKCHLTRFKDQAIATSTVYLFRNIGSVMGVAVGSAIVQNTLLKKLSASLADVPDAEKVS